MADLVGTTVVVPGASRGSGVLRFVGQIRGKSGTFGGIELVGPAAVSRGKNNGDVDGIRYFEVSQPMAGLFLPWDRLRAANPGLPGTDRLKTRPVASKRDSVYTPTPSRRSSPSPRVFHGNGGFPDTGRAFSRTNSGSRDAISGSLSQMSGSPLEVTPKARESSGNGSSIEVAELRAQLEMKTRESDQKDAILQELQATVEELHPVLEDYEKALDDKERKLKKQKNDHDRAREEWRSSLDLMLSSQQEAENLYEMQISDLKEEMAKVMARSHNGNGSEKEGPRITALMEENDQLKRQIADYKAQLKTLAAENSELKLQSAQATKSRATPDSTENGASAEDSELVQSLKKKVDMLTQDVTSMEIVLQDAQAKARAKNAEITELEIQLENFTSKEVEILSDQIVGLSMDDWERDRAQYNAQIDALERKLKDAKENSENSAALSETQRSNEIELAELRKSGHQKGVQLAELQKQIKSLESAQQAPAKSVGGIESSAKIKELTAEKQSMKGVIEDLQKELKSRPLYDDSELTELQNSLEMVERLHRQEMTTLSQKYEVAQEKNNTMETELRSLQVKLADFSTKAQDPVHPVHDQTPGQIYGSRDNSVNPGKIETEKKGGAIPSVHADGGTLPIYKPAKEIDPSEGRDDWCGLCERDGHNSLNCPYENDMF